jgi:DNA-binding transcriptional MerR regulator
VTSNVLTIGQLARLSGLPAHTIRFYESAGVLRPSARGSNGHRRYQDNDVLWLEFVLKLKVTGMPLSEIKCYADLRADGEFTLQQRLTMLELHRDRLVAKMAELQECSSALGEKIRVYRMTLAASKKTMKSSIQ